MPDASALSGCTTFRTADGITFFVLDSSTFAPEHFASLSNLEQPFIPLGGTLLKQARQRFVARVPAIDGSGTLVFKVFPLQHLASRLRYRKYAFREFANLREAQRRGIPVPAPLAYFEKRRLGFVVANGLVIEDLAGWHDLRQFGGTLSAATMACEPLAELWRRGCLHIDARDENILYAPEGHEYRIIDWQYATFHQPRAAWLLEHLAAEYIRKSDVRDRELLVKNWLPVLIARAELVKSDEGNFRKRVTALLWQKPSLRSKLANRPARGIA